MIIFMNKGGKHAIYLNIFINKSVFWRYIQLKSIHRLFISITVLLFIININTYANGSLELDVKSAILIEASSGQTLYEVNSNERLPIASVTKVMTMLLICEALNNGVINMDEMVTVSEAASKMGGSQVYLKKDEQMSVRDMIKAIAVVSANDACMAMAEHIAGSEESFVSKMNKKAEELGMNDTLFINTNGLDDESSGYSSARDVSIMSNELIKHKVIAPFLTIWMDSLRDGAFSLANTNRLIRTYPGANGIKTGSTAKAGYCLSAGAVKDGMQLIAVVLGAPDTNKRFNAATSLLNYGFANYTLLKENINSEGMYFVNINKGIYPKIEVVLPDGNINNSEISILVSKDKKNMLRKQINLPENIDAPVSKGQKIGEIEFYLGEEKIDTKDLVASRDCGKMNIFNMFGKVFRTWIDSPI